MNIAGRKPLIPDFVAGTITFSGQWEITAGTGSLPVPPARAR
jgi:hypothetical protein